MTVVLTGDSKCVRCHIKLSGVLDIKCPCGRFTATLANILVITIIIFITIILLLIIIVSHLLSRSSYQMPTTSGTHCLMPLFCNYSLNNIDLVMKTQVQARPPLLSESLVFMVLCCNPLYSEVGWFPRFWSKCVSVLPFRKTWMPRESIIVCLGFINKKIYLNYFHASDEENVGKLSRELFYISNFIKLLKHLSQTFHTQWLCPAIWVAFRCDKGTVFSSPL